MNEYGACKLEYGLGSSLAVIQAFRHHPYPLVGTYHRGSAPSDQKSCMHQDSSGLEYKRVGNHRQLPGQ